MNLANNELDLPENRFLPNTNISLSFVFVADEAFALGQNLQRPYAWRNLDINQRVFNYRLTRARRFVECTFGIFANKWRIFHTSILVEVDFADDIIKTAYVLHNFVRRRDGCDINDMVTDNMEGIPTVGTGGPSKGTKVRDRFKMYFVNEGNIPFQYEKNLVT
ncbi:hypothetical protein NQ314_002262 [Rhamnusium bicolor]|uniref:DDE Tnp4 domain-containing protein n=1 Tax=Rhamnusium bicolor TaxID=1586634 RepID=A0AAV8ZSP5_9CUCU|nr:hypothetical protein NQ314_002262 [Rhamnusium bicolor]